VERTDKSPSISLARVDNFSSFLQILKEVATGEYQIRIINDEQIEIQPMSIYVNIVKELKSKNTEFHIYKPKQERSFRLKHIHVTANLDDIKKEIKDLGHTVTNIWNIKKQGLKRTFHVF